MLQQREHHSETILQGLNRRFPSDPAVIQLLSRALLDQGENERAIYLLRPYKLTSSSWLPLLPIRAEAEARSGREINSHETMASYYEQQGRTTLALEQIQLGGRDHAAHQSDAHTEHGESRHPSAPDIDHDPSMPCGHGPRHMGGLSLRRR